MDKTFKNKREEFLHYFSPKETAKREKEFIKKITSSKEEGLAFLMEVGIVDENGDLKEPYK